MKANEKQLDLTAGREELDRLFSRCITILSIANFEHRNEGGVTCLYQIDGQEARSVTGSNVSDAARKALVDVSTVLATTGATLPGSFSSNAEEVERFQAKGRNQTIGVTMPSALKAQLKSLAMEQGEPLAEVLRRLVSFGFDDFEQRTLFESTREVFHTLGTELQEWQEAKAEQVMMRLEPEDAVRLKSTAKEHQLSASELGALCVAHGLAMSKQLESLDARVQEFQGPAARRLAEEIGLGQSAGRLLAGVLSGSTRAPREVLSRLANALSAPESLLATYFRKSFDQRLIPSFKAEHGKPAVRTSSTRWETAVKNGGFDAKHTKALLQLGA